MVDEKTRSFQTVLLAVNVMNVLALRVAEFELRLVPVHVQTGSYPAASHTYVSLVEGLDEPHLGQEWRTLARRR